MNSIRMKMMAAVALTALLLVFAPFASAADTVKLGVMYSLTGPGSVLGVLQMEGAKLAVKEINDAGGVVINGKKMMIEGVFRDDETDPQVAIRRLKEMTQAEKVTAIAGGTFGHVSMALNAESKRTKVFLMTTNGVPEKFFLKAERSPTALNIMATSESAGRGAAAYICGSMKAKKVACFMPDYVIGQTTYKGYEAVRAGNKGVSSQPFWVPVNTADMTPYLIKVKEYQPDVLFMGSWGGDAINALKAAHEMGLSKNMKIFHFWLANVFAVGIPAEAMQGVWSQMFWYWDMAGFKDADVVAATKAFSDNYIAAYGNPPDPYAMAAYTGVMETARAMNLAGSTDPKKMITALMAKPQWKGPKGKAAWRADGRPVYKYATYIVEGKGPDQRSGTHAKYDYAKIIDAYDGEAFLPPLAELGY